MLRLLMQHGKVGDIQTPSEHIEQRDYKKLYALIDKIVGHRDGRARLERQLVRWAECAR